MPSSLLLLLPLLGGYLFNHTFHRRRFRAQTKTGHRLIFEAAATGLAFLVVARVVTASLKAYGRPEWVLRVWPEVTGGVAFVGTSMLSVVLAFTTAVAWNLAVGFRHRDQVASDCAADRPLLLRWFYWFWESSYQYSLDLAVRVSGNALQRILHDVVVNGQVDGRCIGLTMKSGKIYSAWVTSSPNL